MANRDERLNQWLRDAHAMEAQAATMLKGLAGRLEHYPELRQRVERHVSETESQAKRLEGCIGRRGADPSAVKDTMGRLTASLQDLSGVFAGDEVVKGAMAGYTFEHFEISAYTALIEAAEAAGDAETAAACREILREEEAMADWMRQHLPSTTRQFLTREEAGAPAKR